MKADILLYLDTFEEEGGAQDKQLATMMEASYEKLGVRERELLGEFLQAQPKDIIK